MTMAGSRIESIPADHFNRTVAVVKLANGTYMPLDPTWVPFCRELWSSAEQQQNYLPGIPGGSDLLPDSGFGSRGIIMSASLPITKSMQKGTLKGSFTITAEGQSDSSIRRIFTQGWQTEWQSTMESQLLNVSPKARMLGVDYGKAPKDYQAGPIRITFRYEIPDYALVGDRELLLKPMVMNNLYASVLSFLRIDTGLETRQYGFRDACSRLVELDETIALPRGYRLAGEPRSEQKSRSGSRLRRLVAAGWQQTGAETETRLEEAHLSGSRLGRIPCCGECLQKLCGLFDC